MLSLDISLAYPGFALRVDESLPTTGVTALFGRSGSGKSSLLRVVAGLERQAKGRVSWQDEVSGNDVWQDARRFVPAHRRGLGYVFQDTRLFAHLTVQGNLDYADSRAHGLPGPGMAEVTEALDLGPLRPRHPTTLSGGEASRVAIGRALLTRPRLLLMDEPLAALDEDRRAEILPYLERLRDDLGIAMLYVSHSTAEVARLANHLLLIEDGKIRLRGTASDLLSDPATAPAFGLREAGAVLTARIEAQEDDGLTRLTTSAGPVLLPRIAAATGTALRLRILARDVIIARTRPEGLSALNILPATVTTLRLGDGPGALVQLRAGEDILRRSASALALAPGTACFAIIKSVSVAPGDIGGPGTPEYRVKTR